MKTNLIIVAAALLTVVTPPLAVSASAQDPSHKTFSPINHNVQSGTGVATIITNIVVTVEKGSSPETMAYSLDYDFYNKTEGDKSSSSNTALIIDFLGANGAAIPGPSVASRNFRDHCTYAPNSPEHRHETGVMKFPYDGFIAQADSVRARDSGVQGYQGPC